MPHGDSQFTSTLEAFNQGIQKGWQLGSQLYVSLQGQTLISLGIGENALGKRMRESDLLLWLSAGKPLTAIALGILLEQLEIPTDSRVCDLIPEFGSAGKEEITVQHLLTHTGGIRDADKLDENLPWDEMISAICATVPEEGWIPGQKAGYHTAGSWYLLGEIIQRLSGQTFAEYTLDRLTRPLGMAHTFLSFPHTKSSTASCSFGLLYNTFAGKLQPHSSWNSLPYSQQPRPGSNIRGPIRDLGRFYEAMLGYGSGSLLSPTLTATYTSRQRMGMYDHTLQGAIDWGYGFLIQPSVQLPVNPAYTYGSHASPATFGHSGNQCACAFADPTHGLVVAWICNGRPGERIHQLRSNSINNAIYQDLGLTV